MQSNAEPPEGSSRPDDNAPREPEEGEQESVSPARDRPDPSERREPSERDDLVEGGDGVDEVDDAGGADDGKDVADVPTVQVTGGLDGIPASTEPARSAPGEAPTATPLGHVLPTISPSPVPPPRRDLAGNLVFGTGTAIGLIVAVAVAVAGVLIHLGMVFLHVAPSNTLSRQHSSAVDGYIYPEFEQNWKLFAPNPLQHNIAVHARVETREGSGGVERGDWVNLTEYDADHIRGNLLPSHTAQNELRRAWDFFSGSHDADDKPTGPRGELSEAYIKRIAVLRLSEHEGVNPRDIHRIQVRSATTPVQPPSWSGEKIKDKTEYRTLPWWTVTETDVPEAAR